MTVAFQNTRPTIDLAPTLAVLRRGRSRSDVVRQHTLKTSIRCAGIGLHSGARVEMTLKPADEGAGIVFRRTDQTGRVVDIKAIWRNVVDTRMCTRLGLADGPSIATVEHLMAALAGAEIDNAIVEVDGPEVPVMDGSAAPFLFMIECVGVVEQSAPRRAIKILGEVEAGTPERFARLSPSSAQTVSFDIDFDSKVIGRQQGEIKLSGASFKAEVSRARTFGFLQDFDQLRAAGLARGGSLDNAVVVSADGVMNDGGLRYDDEFVRHKMLDAIGDLYLAGAPVIGRFHGHRSGHHLHHAVLTRLFSDITWWRWVDMPAAAEERLAATA